MTKIMDRDNQFIGTSQNATYMFQVWTITDVTFACEDEFIAGTIINVFFVSPG